MTLRYTIDHKIQS